MMNEEENETSYEDEDDFDDKMKFESIQIVSFQMPNC